MGRGRDVEWDVERDVDVAVDGTELSEFHRTHGESPSIYVESSLCVYIYILKSQQTP